MVQSDRLQLQNGAYLSQVSPELAELLFDIQVPATGGPVSSIVAEAETGSRKTTVMNRIGQKSFSENVRDNYGRQCCFPGCDISENFLLRAGHIARWADEPQLRGQTSNGLCFCRHHDAAFEEGYFTLDRSFCIVLNHELVATSDWAQKNLLHWEGQQIRMGQITPSIDALRLHWERTEFASLL